MLNSITWKALTFPDRFLYVGPMFIIGRADNTKPLSIFLNLTLAMVYKKSEQTEKAWMPSLIKLYWAQQTSSPSALALLSFSSFLHHFFSFIASLPSGTELLLHQYPYLHTDRFNHS